MDLTEKEIANSKLFEGHLIDLEKRTILLPNGETAIREVVRHPPAVAAAVVNDKQELLLVKQWREPIKQLSLEIPAGLVDDTDPSNLVAMQRELNEEGGYSAAYWEELGQMHTSPGFTDEKVTLFYCDTLTKLDDKKDLDSDEFLTSSWYGIDQLNELISQHQITNVVTLYAISLWKNMLSM